MKKLYFLFTALLLISCSSDGDVSLENDNGFLTVYEDVVFLQEATNQDGYTYSFWLIFSPEGVIDGYYEDEETCFTDFYPWNVEVDGQTFKVIQNSPNTLKLRYTYIDAEYPEDNEDEEITFSVSDNILTFSFDGESNTLYKAPSAPCN